MSTPQYKLTVVACALTWFLVGLHAPVLHQFTHHGRTPEVGLLLVLVLLVIMASGSVWALFRVPRHPDSRPAAP
jgi:hypothetical protein